MSSFWATLPDHLFDRISNLHSGYSNHGYEVLVEPIPGEEEKYIESLRTGLRIIDETMAHCRRRYRVRGCSPRALKLLHSFLPEPVWGVRVKQ